ncbi:acyl carrier protein [Dactylosporangium sp. CA-139114]|uniref:acyl carrier protein n=1 Tax=Dactylosporangium sp. CA-139114 TaxID=3239931 RepID=UPI003D9608F1
MASPSLSMQETQHVLCEIWSGMFGIEVRPDDDFFDLGGNSLRVVDTVIAARLRGISLRSSAVFRHPTPARLARSLTADAAQ